MRNRKALHPVPTDVRSHINLRLERWHRWCLYGCGGWLLVTGLLFLAGHYFLRPVSEFGEATHPLEPWSMRFHGAGAMAALFFLGSLMNSHIRRALKSGRNLYSGWSMIAALLVLIATGYGLYYVASEGNREIWSVVHWVLGLILPFVAVIHIILGRRSRSRQPQR